MLCGSKFRRVAATSLILGAYQFRSTYNSSRRGLSRVAQCAPMLDAQYFLEIADRFVRMARANREIADELESLANEFMKKAVEFDTERDRAAKET
jgi:hypothetical protein